MRKEINAHDSLLQKHEGRKPIESFSLGWEDNIKIDKEGIKCEGVDRFSPIHDRISGGFFVTTVPNLPVS
jgi:hypothetical protein